MTKRLVLFLSLLGLLAAACGTDTVATTDTGVVATTTQAPTTSAAEVEPDGDTTTTTVADEATAPVETITVLAEVWADNWFSLTVNGVFVGEDSVPITTERSFNAEAFTFEATLPMTIAIEAKDFKETDSGIEYIGEGNQQMGDGGVIAQFTDVDTGEIIAVTDGSWTILPVHQAPLDKSCEKAADPDTACTWLILDTPTGWTAVDFDDSAWATANEWSEADVSPKDGYDAIDWNDSARLIWGTDLEIDNTVLLRTVAG